MKTILITFSLTLILASCSTTAHIEQLKSNPNHVMIDSFNEKQTEDNDAYVYAVPFVQFITRFDISSRFEIRSQGAEFGRIQNNGINFQCTVLQQKNNGMILENKKYKTENSLPRLDASLEVSHPLFNYKKYFTKEKVIVFHSSRTSNTITTHYFIPTIEFNRSMRIKGGIDYEFTEKNSYKLTTDYPTICRQTNLALSLGLAICEFSNYRYKISDRKLSSFSNRRSTYQEIYANIKIGVLDEVSLINYKSFNYNLNTFTDSQINPSETLHYRRVGFEVGHRSHFGLGKQGVGILAPSLGVSVGYGDSFFNNCYILFKYTIGFVHYNTKIITDN